MIFIFLAERRHVDLMLRFNLASLYLFPLILEKKIQQSIFAAGCHLLHIWLEYYFIPFCVYNNGALIVPLMITDFHINNLSWLRSARKPMQS